MKKDDGARYFGPFPHSSALQHTLDWLNRGFGLRVCRPVNPGRGRLPPLQRGHHPQLLARRASAGSRADTTSRGSRRPAGSSKARAGVICSTTAQGHGTGGREPGFRKGRQLRDVCRTSKKR
jgi:hypothetical protein